MSDTNSELGHSVGETLAVIEATKALEAKVKQLEQERLDYRAVMQVIVDNGKSLEAAKVVLRGVLKAYATTAPETGQGA